MKETPIIMSGNHPKLILDLEKTMTRRLTGLDEVNDRPDIWCFIEEDGIWQFVSQLGSVVNIKCPYGQVGDQLWVRETCKRFTGIPIKNIAWANNTTWTCAPDKDPFHSLLPIAGNERDIEDLDYHAACVTVPSIHMPRWASRITLEITEVRAERVQEIRYIDIFLEGVPEQGSFTKNFKAYEKLWDSLNAKRGHGWDRNDWVWAIRFKLLGD